MLTTELMCCSHENVREAFLTRTDGKDVLICLIVMGSVLIKAAIRKVCGVSPAPVAPEPGPRPVLNTWWAVSLRDICLRPAVTCKTQRTHWRSRWLTPAICKLQKASLMFIQLSTQPVCLCCQDCCCYDIPRNLTNLSFILNYTHNH